MTKLYIMMGIPGCGKSSLAKKLFDSAIYVGSDDIRVELEYGPDAVFNFDGQIPWNKENNARVFQLFHERIERGLFNYDVIADATSLEAGARKRLFAIAEHRKADVHGMFFNNIGQALTRNKARKHPVPAEAMSYMIEKYQRAREDVHTEPFDSLTFIEAVN